jgi:hypothetical protein
VVTLLRRAAAAATLGADVASQRQTGIGPSGPWYATLLAWGWLLLVFAAQSPAHAIGALWLIAGLPAMRNGYRRRRQAWDRHGAAGLHAVAGAVAVRPLPHAGLARLATVLARTPDDPSAALRAVAQACPDAGVAGLVPFYAALAAGAVPAGVWSPLTPRGPVVEDAASVPSAASLPAGGSVGAPADEVPGAPAEAQQGALPDEAPGARHGEASLDPQEAAPAERPARAVDARPAEVDAGPAGVAGGRSEGGAVRTSSTPT